MPVLARNVVATSQPLAVQAGLAMFERGGNAVDAALAAAIALVVVEPTGNGIGSDAFALVCDGEHLYGLNASGHSPAAADAGRLAGATAMPLLGWDAVTVPGAVSAWHELSERFGCLPFDELFEPAVAYAREGFLVSPLIAELWATVAPVYEGMADFARAFLPEGRPPRAGEVFRLEGLADSLESIADSGGASLYGGALAERIVEHARATGGLLDTGDLATHRAEWVAPLWVDYRGWRLHELPPNGQGLAALIALGLLAEVDLARHPVDSADSLHLQIEAMKLAVADAGRFIADPTAMDVPTESLLDPAYLAERARSLDGARAGEPGPGRPAGGDTVYLTAADRDGLMVSYIQSNYFAFGSGIVVPGTGISLQNRGACFSLDAGHPNRFGPSKRPFHTIIPAFLSRDGQPVMSFGVMGGAMQPQGHVQLVVRLADYGQNPQAAIDAPRWQVMGGREVAVEAGFPAATIAELKRRGHVVRVLDPVMFGGAQAVMRLATGYLGASDPRKDGLASGI